MVEGGDTPGSGPTGDPDPFGGIFDLAQPDAAAPPLAPSVPLAPVAPTAGSVAPESRRRPLIVGVIAAVVIVVVGVGGIFVYSKASAAISAGSGTATITWTRAPDSGDASSDPAQSFSGEINGHSLSGVSTVVIPTSITDPSANPTTGPKDIAIFHYKGSFAGKPFEIEVLIHLPISVGSPNSESFVVEGTYDGQAIHASLGQPPNPDLGNSPIPFTGTVGKWQVTGMIHGPTGRGSVQTATATFTVTG